METVRLFFLYLAIAFSFGGFSFYAAVVVPIGSNVFDATSQGFITQQVTNIINVASAVTLFTLVWEGLASRHRRSPSQNTIFVGLLATYAICLTALFMIHPQLDALLDNENLSVEAPDKFYNLHRVYLWVSTIEWLATIGLIWLIASKKLSKI